MAYLKSELSCKNVYHLSKHRYLELVHFCRQYPEWKKLLQTTQPHITTEGILKIRSQLDEHKNEETALIRAALQRNIELVERVAASTDEYLGRFILLAVTEGLSFPQLKMREHIACEKNMYYDRYRKFFYFLSQEKGI